MNSIEILIYGDPEGSAYNDHFESTCYHPPLLFGREGRYIGWMTKYLGIWLITLLPSLPLLSIYLAFRSVLDAKKNDMRMLLMRGESLAKYLSTYGRRQESTTPDLKDKEALLSFVSSIVNKIFWLQYSDWEYFFAMLFNVVVTVLLMTLAMSSVGIPMGLPPVLMEHLPKGVPLIGILAGGVGALLCGVYEFTERYRSGDLAPDSIFRMGSRMLIVSAVGALVGTVVNEHIAWIAAFGIGFVPITTVKTFLANIALKALKLPSVPENEEDQGLIKLQGWNQEVREKLQRAGIYSVQQLACTNPFQIFLRSNLDWRVILDLCDQALLAVYIGDKAESIRALGFRSASELAEIDWSKDEAEYFSDFTRDDAIKEIAAALKTETLQTRMLIRSLSEDITVELIATLWSDDTPGEHNDDDASPENGDDKKSQSETGGTQADQPGEVK